MDKKELKNEQLEHVSGGHVIVTGPVPPREIVTGQNINMYPPLRDSNDPFPPFPPSGQQDAIV